MLLGLNPFRTWLVIGICVALPLSLHAQKAMVAMLWASEFPRDRFNHPRLGSLAPSLCESRPGLSLFTAACYLVSKAAKGLRVGAPARKTSLYSRLSEQFNMENWLPPLLSEAQLRPWLYEDTFWFQKIRKLRPLSPLHSFVRITFNVMTLA